MGKQIQTTKGNRALAIIVMSLLLLGTFIQGPVTAFAEGTAKQVKTQITDFEIQHKNHTTADKLFYTDEFLLKMKWDASENGTNIHEGDFFNVALPDSMRFPSNVTATDFDLLDDNNVVIAKAHVTPGPGDNGGNVRVTFTKAAENKYNVKGTMYLAAKFNKKVIKYDEYNTFTVTVNNDLSGQSQTIETEVEIVGPKVIENEYLYKWGGRVDGNPNQAHWHARINHVKASMSNAVITDTLKGTGETFVPDSFVLKKVEFNQYANVNNIITDNIDISSKLTFTDNNQTFNLNLGNISSNDQYVLEYKSTYTQGTSLKNKLQLDYEGNHKETTSTYVGASSGGTGNGDIAGKIRLIKVDAENNTTRLSNAVFTVTKADGSTFELTTGSDGVVTSGLLEQGTYKVKEKYPPAGYELNSTEYTLKVTETSGALQTITNKPIKIDIAGEKTWNDNNNQDMKRPESITVNLLANGNKVAEQIVKADENGNWKYSFKNLRKYDGNNEINYTITENAVSEYSTEVNGYNIENSYIPKKTSATVTKEWSDENNQDGKRPNSVKVQLYANNEKYGEEVELNYSNGWTHTWSNLPEKKDGNTIKYTVKEVGTIADYTTTIDDSNHGNMIICNKHKPEVTTISGTKTWTDNGNQDGERPESITVNLLANGVKQASTVVKKDSDGNWKYSFDNLPKYKNGKEIIYTVTEDPIAGYSTKINGYDITNTHTPGKTSMTVTKSWNDENNQDGKRPDMVKVQLYADNEKYGEEVQLSVDNKWTNTWNNLPEKKNGKKINYTVEEVEKITGYEESIDNSNPNNVLITNTHRPEKIDINGEKTWKDSGNQDGKRPKSVNVNLLADGIVVATKTVTADDNNNWKYSFKDLPKYKNGKEIVYTVTEDTVSEYSTEVNGYDITNSYTPKETSVTVTKCWNDSNNKDKIRAKNIMVQLYANGEKTGSPVALNEKNKWSTTWSKLPQKHEGKDIKYTVKEVKAVTGYTSTVNDKNHGNIILTNSHTPNDISNPKTGDNSNILVYILLLIGSLGTIVVITLLHRRRQA